MASDPAPDPVLEHPSDPAVGPPTVRVRGLDEIVAAVPVLLGFHPRRSLVLVSTGGPSGRRLGLTLRIDLPPPGHVGEAVDVAVQGLMLDRPRGALVVAVDERGEDHVAQLVTRTAAALAARGIAVQALLWAAGTEAGRSWACCEQCRCTGTVPGGTVLAAAAAVEGRLVRSTREELERAVAPADAGRLRRREVRYLAGIDGAAAKGSSAPTDPREGVAMLDAAVADAAAGRLTLDDERVCGLAAVLGTPAVRAAAVRHSTGPCAAPAEQLWAALTRETPDPEAAEPATMLAVAALLRGDGALANVALDRAEQAWPGHRLARTLAALAAGGVRPDALRRALRDGAVAGFGRP